MSGSSLSKEVDFSGAVDNADPEAEVPVMCEATAEGRFACVKDCVDRDGEMGGDPNTIGGEEHIGGGDATKLGVVLPEAKNISLDGVPPRAEEEDAAGL